MTAASRLTVVGAQPPPMQGAAQVTAYVAAIAARQAAIRIVDIAPRRAGAGIAYHLVRLGRVLRALARIAAGGFGRAGGAVYLSAAGGGAVVYDILIAAMARLMRRPFFIHHHSFAYIDRFDAKRAFLARLAGAACVHICLCPRMADGLRRHYPSVARTVVLSNTAFVPVVDASPARTPRADAGLVLGHLSNLSRDKGLDTVIETFAAAGAAARRLVLAGAPVDGAAADLLARARERFGARLEEWGPVAGARKTAFFSAIDVFLFPTRYVNEAEPLVVIEALSAGVPVIAYGRGCIPHMIPDGAGRVVAVEDDYAAAAVGQIAAFERDPAALSEARSRAIAGARRLHQQSQPALEQILAELTGGGRGRG